MTEIPILGSAKLKDFDTWFQRVINYRTMLAQGNKQPSGWPTFTQHEAADELIERIFADAQSWWLRAERNGPNAPQAQIRAGEWAKKTRRWNDLYIRETFARRTTGDATGFESLQVAIQESLGPGVQRLSEEELNQEIFHFLREYRQCIHAEEGNVTTRLNVDSLVDSLKSSVNVKDHVSYFRTALAVYNAVLKWYSERMSIAVDADNAMQDGSYFPALHGALKENTAKRATLDKYIIDACFPPKTDLVATTPSYSACSEALQIYRERRRTDTSMEKIDGSKLNALHVLEYVIRTQDGERYRAALDNFLRPKRSPAVRKLDARDARQQAKDWDANHDRLAKLYVPGRCVYCGEGHEWAIKNPDPNAPAARSLKFMCERQKPARPEWRDEDHRPWIIFFKKRLGLFTDPSPSKDATQAKKKQQRSKNNSS
jgi:hypothetical protein